MESLKVMEKFDGGNFHLWKFKMHMMLFKHGLWKFVDGSATLASEELATADYNEKKMKAFALLCEHLTDAQLVLGLKERLCDIRAITISQNTHKYVNKCFE